MTGNEIQGLLCCGTFCAVVLIVVLDAVGVFDRFKK